MAVICGPPPWTTTARMPAYRRKTTSSANACLQRLVGHGVAAVLHHDGPAAEPLEPRQRLDEDACLREGVGVPAHVEYAEFSWT